MPKKVKAMSTADAGRLRWKGTTAEQRKAFMRWVAMIRWEAYRKAKGGA